MLNANPDWRSPLGGMQGQIGKFMFLGDYLPKSLQDGLADAYSGTHDTLNSSIWYGADGNIRPGMTKREQDIGELLNKANVLMATPFAIAALLPSEILNIISTMVRK